VLLDLIHSDYAHKQFKPSSWHEANEDVVVCRERKLQNEGVLVREIVLSKERGLIRDVSYFARLFQPQDMEALLTESSSIASRSGEAGGRNPQSSIRSNRLPSHLWIDLPRLPLWYAV